jgi:mono/diheme cytochrome c family protein
VLDPVKKSYVSRKEPTAIPYATRQIIQGQGMFNQFCAPCHGLSGHGDGYGGRDMWIPPANFTLPKYANYSEAKWFWRVSEGIPGAQMPRWIFALTVEQRWYLVRYLQYINATSNPGLHPPDDEFRVVTPDQKKVGLTYKDLLPEAIRHRADMADRYFVDAQTSKPLVDPKTGKPMLDPVTGGPRVRPGWEGAPPMTAPLVTPAPAGANPGGLPATTLPVELLPSALRTPGAPAPGMMVPTSSPSLPGVGIVPGGELGAGNPTPRASSTSGLVVPRLEKPITRRKSPGGNPPGAGGPGA